MSGVFIQIFMTRFFDLVTGTNLARWLQQDNLVRSQVVQETTQTPKIARPIRVENHALLESGESRTCSVEKSIAQRARRFVFR